MATRKPRIEYYWSGSDPAVNVRFVAANGEVVGQITQGFRDKTDARRGVGALRDLLNGGDLVITHTVLGNGVREVGPGRKPS